MRRRLIRVSDVAKELQTEEFKLDIYSQIQKFVYKYQKRYFPHFRGNLDDLAIDLFEKFCRPVKHRNGDIFSELDRVDPARVGGGEWRDTNMAAIATYTQR